MKLPSAISNRARAVYGYLILISLAFAVSSCAAPYYGSRSVPVYFPLYGRYASYRGCRLGRPGSLILLGRELSACSVDRF